MHGANMKIAKYFILNEGKDYLKVILKKRFRLRQYKL